MSRFFAEDFSTDHDSSDDFFSEERFSDDQMSQISYKEDADSTADRQSNIRKSRFLAASEGSDSDDAFQQKAIKSSSEKTRSAILNNISQLNSLLEDSNWIDFNEIFENIFKSTHNFTKFCDNNELASSLRDLNESFSLISKNVKSKHLNTLQSKAFISITQKFKKMNLLIQKGDKEISGPSSFIDIIPSEKTVHENSNVKALLDSRNRNFAGKIENLSDLQVMFANATCHDERVSLLLAITSNKLEIVKNNFETSHYFTEILKDFHCLMEIIPHASGQYIEANNVKAIIQSHLSRIDDEFFKILNNFSSSQDNYISFLENEKKLVHIIYSGLEYLCENENYEIICNFKLRILEHCYHRRENVIVEVLGKKLIVYELVEYIYKYGSTASKIRALLYHCYHIALHGFSIKALGLLQKSKLFDFVCTLGTSEQVLYNRLLVQIGISSFQNCQIKDAYSSLFDLYNSGRVKDLICQMDYTQMRFSYEGDKLPQFLPMHIHFDTELIDFIFIASSVFIEFIYNLTNLMKMERKFSQNKFLKKFIDQFHKNNYISGSHQELNDLISFAIKLFACKAEEAKKILYNNKIWRKYFGKSYENAFNLLINKIINLIYCTRFGKYLDVLDESLEIFVPGN